MLTELSGIRIQGALVKPSVMPYSKFRDKVNYTFICILFIHVPSLGICVHAALNVT